MGMIPPRIVPPRRDTFEDMIEQLQNTATPSVLPPPDTSLIYYPYGRPDEPSWLSRFWQRIKCIDCGFWLSLNACRECGKSLCGVCVEWPSPRLHSPGKGMCSTCRKASSQRFADNPPGYSKIWQLGGLTTQEVGDALSTMFGTTHVTVCENEQQEAQLAYVTQGGMVIGYPELEQERGES